jgi:hypothetical protein
MNGKIPIEPEELERLRVLTAEDTDSPEEAEALLQVVTQLRSWKAPEATPSMTAHLLEALLPEVTPPLTTNVRRFAAGWPLLLMRAQLRVVHREIWAASALVMTLGIVVTLATYQPGSAALTPLAIFAPLVAAVGVAFLYDTDVEAMFEIENSTPASARMLLLARLTLVFGFDLALGLAGSVLLAVLNTDVLLWPLVVSWLAPMAFLSAGSFFLSIMLGDALIGSAFGLLVWGVHVLLRMFPAANPLITLLSLPGLATAENRPVLFTGAALLVVVALWIAGREDRIVNHAE